MFDDADDALLVFAAMSEEIYSQYTFTVTNNQLNLVHSPTGKTVKTFSNSGESFTVQLIEVLTELLSFDTAEFLNKQH